MLSRAGKLPLANWEDTRNDNGIGREEKKLTEEDSKGSGQIRTRRHTKRIGIGRVEKKLGKEDAKGSGQIRTRRGQIRCQLNWTVRNLKEQRKRKR